MVENIENTHYFYLPTYTLSHIFDDINYLHDNKIWKFFENFYSVTRKITLVSRKTQKSVYESYVTINILTYGEGITVTFMQLYEIRHIISFNKKLWCHKWDYQTILRR